ncbi:MAG: UDP-glucose/GDP-mannose dehydrogenase family protein [Kofleriaceae bacterium]|nr:UDP-glucose/GDP-mannose dehydrogenase family protein [Myxococcales bacterium]MCB9560851.1 UDP-glucose/GDP-mannose dehydrogenase family protein [Kofleriaceae bacterium]
MKLAVIGTGYVGLVVGAGFSDFGNHVTCVDIDADRVARLTRGEIPIHEPGLDALVARNVAAGRLAFTTETAAAVAGAEVVFLAVPTPPDARGAADLRYVDDAVAAVARAVTGFTVVVTKSTVPVGTAARVRAQLAAEARHDTVVAANPEFLKEGAAVADFMRPDRVVLGVDDPRAERVLRALYAAVVRTDDRVHVMDIASAELTKYAANAMLAVRISFMNELAGLAEVLGGDIEPIRRALGADPRIGRHFLFPGPGYGGSCLPKDVRALAHAASAAGQPLEIVEAADLANQRQRGSLAPRLAALCGGSLRGKRIALWGLAFKAETDDVRETAALPLIGQLRELGATVVAYDPAAMTTMRALIGDDIAYAADEYAAAAGADALVVVTDWKQFRSPDFRRLRRDMAAPVVFDTRNLWDPEDLRARGFTYRGVGRPLTSSAPTGPR